MRLSKLILSNMLLTSKLLGLRVGGFYKVAVCSIGLEGLPTHRAIV